MTARRPERARRRRGGGGPPAASCTARASRTIPRSSRGWPSGTRCWATRPATLRAVRDPLRLGAALARRRLRVPADVADGRSRAIPPLAAQAGARRRWHARARLARRRAAGGDARPGAHRRARLLGGGSRRRRGRRRARAHRAARRAAARSASAATAGAGTSSPPRLPAGEQAALLGQARAICSHLAGAFALRGLFGVDFIWDGERAWTLEVNPRPTASLEAIEAAYGIGVVRRAPARLRR